jgi:hypothetical protein
MNWTFSTSSMRIILSFAAYLPTTNAPDALTVFRIYGHPMLGHVRVEIQGTTNTLWVRNDQNGTALLTLTNALTAGSWRWLSIDVLIASSGFITISDETLTTRASVSGVSTKNTGSNSVNTVTLYRTSAANSNALDIDDVIIMDDTGPTWNQRIPDTYLVTIRPNGPGTDISPGWTVTGASDIYAAVNETSPTIDGDTTYVSRTDSGRFTSSYGDVTIPDHQIRGLIAGVATKRGDSGLWKVSNAIRLNGTTVTYEQMKATPEQRYHSFLNWIETNPHLKTPWTQAEINAMEHGPDVVLI